jgi:hypothetical protein
MRVFISAVVTGVVSLGLVHASDPVERPDPVAIEARLRKVREQLEKFRAEERNLAEQLADAKESVPGSIKGEVTGVLRHTGKGENYYISVWSANGETRIWILPANDKERDEFGTLHGKVVVASGQMYQRHAPKTTPLTTQVQEVPEGSFYMWPSKIVAGPDPGPKK